MTALSTAFCHDLRLTSVSAVFSTAASMQCRVVIAHHVT